MAFRTISDKVAGSLSQSLVSIPKDTPLPTVTTSSLDALISFADGLEFQKKGGAPRTAEPFFTKAVELDPDFAMAYFQLHGISGAAYRPIEAEEYLEKAYGLVDKISAGEKDAIELGRFEAHGETEAALVRYRTLMQLHPEDGAYHWGVADLLDSLGRHTEAIAEYETCARLMPAQTVAQMNLVAVYLEGNRIAEGKVLLDKFLEAHKAAPTMRSVSTRYELALYENDDATAAAMLKLGQSGSEEQAILGTQMAVLMTAGRVREERTLFTQADELARRTDRKDSAVWQMAGQARNLLLYGYLADGSKMVHSTAAEAHDNDSRAMVGLIASLLGDSQITARMVSALDAALPSSTIVHGRTIPDIEAALQLSLNHPEKTIELLQVAGGFGDEDMTAYLRAEALLKLNQPEEAAKEFRQGIARKIHRVSDPIYPLSVLGLARSAVLAGNRNEARKQYEQLFELWKAADPDLPPLIAARAEYGRLGKSS